MTPVKPSALDVALDDLWRILPNPSSSGEQRMYAEHIKRVVDAARTLGPEAK
jgi:hypothetical protein